MRDDYEWLSFDCYGTLIDWERGICNTVSEVLDAHGLHKEDAEILELFAEVEPRVQNSSGFMEYRSVLHCVMEVMGREFSLDLSEAEKGCLAESLPNWPVFEEVSGALEELKSRHKLAIISNIDDDLFASTARALGVDFDVVVTAQRARSYKPNLRNFQIARKLMGVDTSKWLHVAESLYHDIAPANQLGIASVWVDRPGRGGGTRISDAIPDVVVPDLAALAKIMRPVKSAVHNY